MTYWPTVVLWLIDCRQQSALASIGRTGRDVAGVVIMSSAAFHLGGMERIMQTLGRELPRRGVPVTVIIPNKHIASDVCTWFRESGVTVLASDALARISQGDSM